MFVNGSGWNEQSLQRTFKRCFLPSYGSFDQTVSEEKNFKSQPIRNKNSLWRPCLLTDLDEMSNLYRGPSIDASYQVSIHLATRFQRRFKKKRPFRNNNCLWWPCLLMDRDEMSKLYRGPSIRVHTPFFARKFHDFSRTFPGPTLSTANEYKWNFE
jgi:hypothetical protein